MKNDHNESQGRIWIVDDDEFFRDSIAQNLIHKGYEVEAFGDGPALLANLTDDAQIDLLLLDWKMPEMNGIDVLRHVREGGHDLPVIFLTVLSEQIYEEAALLGGAVDFIEKSRSFTIVLRRIELILGGQRGTSDDAGDALGGGDLTVGPLRLDLQSRRAYWQRKPVDLTYSEFSMVHALASRANKDVAYRDIYDVVRGRGFQAGQGSEGYRANVRSSIKRIRHKFREIDPSFDWIENYPGFGYKWRVYQ
ncbi:MAG: DNA-binding response regulator [Rhodospirillales bacterium CG15_BIG_FIL_POST_REV_8_21_14_020_66_15]|nr:MAG: DNA-binding response regulator [Rhodospirillales bacterium CG15_BIG_FIL_POST_REV_8_21_14_020_66_15]